MISRFPKTRTICLLLSAGVFSIMLLGGCPARQTPTIPPPEEQEQPTQPMPPAPEDGLDRPIEQPSVGDGTTTSGPGGSIPTGEGEGEGGEPGTGGGGGGGGGLAVSIESPSTPVRIRPGTVINLEFDLLDPSGSLDSGAMLLARDDDADGQPDGAAVLVVPIAIGPGFNAVAFNADLTVGFLSDGFGRFVLGVQVTTIDEVTAEFFSPATITVDAQAPQGTWLGVGSPPEIPLDQEDHLVSRDTDWTVELETSDNSPHSVRILLDPDEQPESGNEFEFVEETTFEAGTGTRTFTRSLLGTPAGTYRYYVILSDGVDPPTAFYAEKPGQPGTYLRLSVTNRLIGPFPLDRLTNHSQGAILQGFNFNDLAGSSVAAVPDLTGDGRDELIVGSRFGKAFIIEHEGVGFGEAYLIYGSEGRLRGVHRLNSVGETVPGLAFPGIRTPMRRGGDGGASDPAASIRWTFGLSDITVVDDMDGDDLPELVFSFPRAESINLGETDPTVQHPDLRPDLPGMGSLEYNAYYIEGMFYVWHPHEAQFTRGGIVIVSSHNEMLRNPNLLNRKSDRVIDLHEVGQLFSSMHRPGLVAYIRQALTRTEIDGAPFTVCADCDGEPPDGCEPGDADTDPPTPGDCGDDDCISLNDAPPPDGYRDGREQEIQRWYVRWDVVFDNQGPGGFHQEWTIPIAEPPLVRPDPFWFNPMWPFPFTWYPNHWVFQGDACFVGDGCEVTNEWYVWDPVLPGTMLAGTPSWATSGAPFQDPPVDCYPDNPCITEVEPEDGPCPADEPNCVNPDVTVAAVGYTAWTGFYGPESWPRVYLNTGESYPAPVGARILGQAVDDQFGTAISSDGTWLYISAPERTVNQPPYSEDVPDLGSPRTDSGVVYQLRTHAPGDGNPNGPTRTQLWIEPGTRPDPNDPNSLIILAWPYVDAEDPTRRDYTMPVPHQYIIESVGSLRGNPEIGIHETAFPAPEVEQDCPPDYDPGIDSPDADAVYAYTPYPAGTAGYYMDRTPQIVGPHPGAKLRFVRALGDVNDDGYRDFAVGSDQIQDPNSGAVVGAIYIVFSRPTGLEGDYLLERLHLRPGDPDRLHGVMLKGASAGEKLARVFDDAGDFNGDGIADVVVGNPGADSDTGEVIVIFGSRTIESPAGGWTVDDIVAAGRAVRFRGASVGDQAGANVAGAGDVDADGYSDILIAAPGAEGGAGAVYLIYGSSSLQTLEQPIGLTRVGTVDVPGVRFIGRRVGDAVGAGSKTVTNTAPAGAANTAITAFSRGVARLGDIDGDGFDDYAISAMLADPDNRTDAGEVYILYGRGD